MKKHFYLAAFVAGSLLFTACKSTLPLTPIESTATIPWQSIHQDSLAKNLQILSSPAYEGRKTGEPGQKKAAQYLVNFYERIGLPVPPNADSYLQQVPASFMSKSRAQLKDSENVWAFLEGSEKPEEVLIITSHYDHVGMSDGEVYPGADDNGSGTVALMEIARIFKHLADQGIKPKRSILFMHLTGEEYGLFGSRYYVENPIFPLDQAIADLNIDMVGRRSTEYKKADDYIYLVGSDKLSTDLHNLSEEANKESVNLTLDYTFNDDNDPQRIYYRSDHYSFAKNGIPSLFYYNGTHEDYHKPTDTFDKIDLPLLKKRTQLIFTTAWKLANAAERPAVNVKQ